MHSTRVSWLGVAFSAFLAAPALANDSTAALGAGGLELVRNVEIDLLSEDLYISPDEIRVAYRFRNHTNAPVTYLVAFPLPAIDSTTPEATNFILPDPASENFVDFAVTVDGKPVTPSLSQRALALGVDHADVLRAHGLPLNPATEGLWQVIEKLPKDEIADLNRLGLVLVDPYNVQAAWKLEATFYWEQTFPPGEDVVVEHRYKPVVGFSFFGKESLDLEGYATKYCVDDAFRRAALSRLEKIATSENPYFQERRISYILTTANNWATPIGDFRVVIDKGSEDQLVSFCGSGVKKIGPTQFEMRATDYVPEHELEILIVGPRKEE